MDNVQRLAAARHYWDDEAATFDHEPDHGLRDPVVHRAWTNLLVNWLPPVRAEILDIGCGTGSLSVLLAGLGHAVTGIDLSPTMVAHAELKALAAGHRIAFTVMDASDPQLSTQRFDGILCRHLLWTLPEPALVLRRWMDMLAPGGRLLLIEGYWKTGGLHAHAVTQALPALLTNVLVQNLSDQSALWGGAVMDERYAVIADLPAIAS